MTAVAVTTLALQVAFLVLALGWRAFLQRMRTGDWGVRRPATPSARWASALLVAAFGAGGAAALIELFGDSSGNDVAAAPQFAGIALLAVAIAGTVHAQLALGASWRVGVDPGEALALVTSGPFAVVRNPIFTWMVVAAAGVALAVPGVLTLFGVVCAVVGVELQVRLTEEPYLRSLHGAAYDRYCARVGRFVPGIGRRAHVPAPEARSV